MLTESEIPLKLYGSVMHVIASLRPEVERELARIGAPGEWFIGVHGIGPDQDHGDGGPTTPAALWSLVVENPADVSALQTWIDARNCTPAD